MSEYTQGPWSIVPGDTIRRPLLIRADGFVIGEAHWNEHMDGDPEANARLMAAAPDLLDALKRARVALKANEDLSGTWALYQASPEMKAINAAITKAEGR